MEFVLQLLQNPAIIAGLILIIGRLIPNDKLEAWGFGIGSGISSFGRSKLGIVYETIENFLQNSVGVFLRSLDRGLDQDDPDPKE